MKSISIIVCAALLAVSAAGQAGQRGRSLESPVPPVPPTLPAPPAPPAPPALLPPPPPLPPEAPVVPEKAHAACVGKPVGSQLSLSPAKGVTMSGTCQKDSKGMYFELQSYNSQS